ncbi:Flp family type IVb pilin [Anaerovibrio sp. RM50]|uniref:Flp family type IVb pilin n=1 Tax=Anaerovibrio sp. RM50 TaxID=1200557 RepID=UPI0004852303|nr:hypothetical protein [Anaerovibrio sp. RM50]
MFREIGDMKRQKGQGIVEYALLLAFILAIAIALQGSGLDSAIAGTFNRVAQSLGFETSEDQWKTMNANDLLNDTASAEARLKHDKDFLADIGTHFLGLTASELQSKYNINSNKIPNGGVLVGHLTEERDADGNLISTNHDTNGGSNKTKDFYAWATGSSEYDNTRRYLYSDYALKHAQDDYNGNGKTTGNGIKIMGFTFDDNNQVNSVHLIVNPLSLVNNPDPTTPHLEVTVTKNGYQ